MQNAFLFQLLQITGCISIFKSKSNSVEVLTSNALIDLVISHDGFIIINNVLKEYDNIKEGIKNLKT